MILWEEGVSPPPWFVPLPGALARLPDLTTSRPLPSIGFILLSAVLVYLLLDWWLYGVYGTSISQWVLRHARASDWFRWLGIALMAFLSWHWFFGLPGKVLRGLRRAIRPIPPGDARRAPRSSAPG